VNAPTSRARSDPSGGRPRSETIGEVSTIFPAVAPSASSARRFVAAALHRWGCPDAFVDLVLLLTSELVTNAYRHAGSETRVSVRCDEDRIRVEVSDKGGGELELRPLDSNRTDGRGLQIVDGLAERWGHHSDGDGTVVWFELVHPGVMAR
jgi:anti-sigma regulatory factor (Ser/Thr protein kinase)